MNWDSNAPLELLSSMPAQLNKKNLKDIQAIIDKDKFVCSNELTRDLCGEYAPFCAICDKKVKYPCAVAYVKMKQADGMQVEIAISDDDVSDEEDEVSPEPAKEQPAEKDEIVPPPVIVAPVESKESVEEEAPVVKKRIRIAIAKRKSQ